MQQQGDSHIIDLLNNLYIADVKLSDTELLESKVIHSDHLDYAHEGLHVYGENATGRRHNLACLQSVKSRL